MRWLAKLQDFLGCSSRHAGNEEALYYANSDDASNVEVAIAISDITLSS